MGKALTSGDIDVMTRAMSPGADQRARRDRRKGRRAHRDARPGDPLPRLQHRRPVGEGPRPSARPWRAVVDRGSSSANVYGATAEPLYSLIPTQHHRAHQLVLQQVRRPRPRQKAAAVLRDAGISTPVKLTLHYTTDHYGAGTAQEFEALRDQLNAHRALRRHHQGRRVDQVPPRRSKRGDYAVYGMGWFPDFPDPDNYIAPVPRQGQLPQLALRDNTVPRRADPAVPARGRPHRRGRQPSPRSRTSSPTMCPCCRCGRASSTSPPATTSPGSSTRSTPAPTLQLWELGRGGSRPDARQHPAAGERGPPVQL